jgi:hypothetical protein
LMGGAIKTSKILLAVTGVAGLALLFMEKLKDPPSAICYGVILAIFLWNRMDSRNHPYSFKIKGPAGIELNLARGESGDNGADKPIRRDGEEQDNGRGQDQDEAL